MFFTHTQSVSHLDCCLFFSGAIAGTPFDIDRELLRKGLDINHQIIHCPDRITVTFDVIPSFFLKTETTPVTAELDFEDISLNSMDATGQRDFVGT